MQGFFSRLSIKSKVILHFTFIFFAVAIFYLLYFPKIYKEDALDNLKAHIQHTAEMMALSIATSLELNEFDTVVNPIHWAKGNPHFVYFEIFDQDGSSRSVFNPEKLKFNSKELLEREGVFEYSGRLFFQTSIHYGKNVHGKLLTGYSMREISDGILRNQVHTLKATGFIFIFGLVASILLSKRIIQPLVGLAQATEEVSHGNLKIKIPVHSEDEIGQLAKSFKRMVENINHTIQDRDRAQHEMEQAKIEAESSSQAKSIFLANMSHEIRTPMNAVLGYSQLLLMDPILLEEHRDTVRVINNSGNNLLELINDILDISKIEAGRMEQHTVAFDLYELLNGLAEMFKIRCQQKLLEWKLEGIEGESLPVNGEEGKLRQVLTNLLGNAIKFTESGSVTLRVEDQGWDRYLFSVIDTGPGIPEAAREVIFLPFRQDEEGLIKGGTGLGLSISKKQTEFMGGELLLESEMGQGTRFYFLLYLPPAQGKVAARGPRFNQICRLAPGYKVDAMVIDKVKENRDILSRMLMKTGVDVVEVENEGQAIEALARKVPDIVFLDIRVPMVGEEQMMKQAIQEFARHNVKMVAVSASVLKHERDHYIQLGCHEVIMKPFRYGAISNCLIKNLNIKLELPEPKADHKDPPSQGHFDPRKFVLPQPFYSNLLKVAQSRNITRLKQVAPGIEKLGPEYQLLHDRLMECIRNFDTEGVLSILEKVSSDE